MNHLILTEGEGYDLAECGAEVNVSVSSVIRGVRKVEEVHCLSCLKAALQWERARSETRRIKSREWPMVSPVNVLRFPVEPW